MLKFDQIRSGQKAIAVVGLGYVGLPLAVALARKFRVTGFDIDAKRVDALKKGLDSTQEVSRNELAASSVTFSAEPAPLAEAGMIIIAVPTPVDAHCNPDLGPVLSASRLVGQHMRPGCVVVYESTVYPGVTEDVCAPALEEASGLRAGRDFSLGYSPERINPGDKVHTLNNVVKLVSASDASTLDLLAKVYGSVVAAGVHRASSIKVAEAAKVIENTQRDINIALMNELAIIFGKMGLDTQEVLEAAGTKWNFLPFRPGLVGGHCIGVDPYYLTYKAEELGYRPEVILAGRRVNDRMGKTLAEQCVKQLIRLGLNVSGARVGVLGLTFKENVPDLRNTRVVDMLRELEDYGIICLVHDPMADPQDAWREYGCKLRAFSELRNLDALILAVAHEQFRGLKPENLATCFKPGNKILLLDVKSFWNKEDLLSRGYAYWRL
jgi:UDP-N-acetyl-D-galactosamine dehydrogenase